MRVHLIFLLAAAAAFTGRGPVTPTAVVPNDNRTPAGRLVDDTLVLDLVLDSATWFPQGPGGPSVVVGALAEAGKPPQTPAPLIRVPAGTAIRATIHNALDSVYVVRGLHSRPGTPADSVVLRGGATGTYVLAAGAPGTCFYDALPSGYVPPRTSQDTTVAPSIAPGGSFVARLTVPRAGTFIYHTHMNDVEQLTSGLYGAIVVVEPGQRYDPVRDHLAVIGWDGDAVRGRAHILVNGDSAPKPFEVRAGTPHRLRFVNIGPAGVMRLELKGDSSPAEWRRLALDGAALPAEQAILAPATHRIAVGQTADFEIRLAPGTYALTYLHNPITPILTQTIIAR